MWKSQIRHQSQSQTWWTSPSWEGKPTRSNPGTTAPKDRAVDVSGSKVSPPAAVGIVCSSLPVQRATINGLSLKGGPICLTWKQSTLAPMNAFLFLLDYRKGKLYDLSFEWGIPILEFNPLSSASCLLASVPPSETSPTFTPVEHRPPSPAN